MCIPGRWILSLNDWMMYAYVTIQNYGFRNADEELPLLFNDLAGGFTTVLDGLKAYLEHGINLDLIADKFPQQRKVNA